MPEAVNDGRLVFDCFSAFLLLLTALIGAYLPRYLSSKGSLQSGSTTSLAFHLMNMLSGGVMLSAGFCHLLADALRQLTFIGRFPISTFLAASGYLVTLLADQIVQVITAEPSDSNSAGRRGQSQGYMQLDKQDSGLAVEMTVQQQVSTAGGTGNEQPVAAIDPAITLQPLRLHADGRLQQASDSGASTVSNGHGDLVMCVMASGGPTAALTGGGTHTRLLPRGSAAAKTPFDCCRGPASKNGSDDGTATTGKNHSQQQQQQQQEEEESGTALLLDAGQSQQSSYQSYLVSVPALADGDINSKHIVQGAAAVAGTSNGDASLEGGVSSPKLPCSYAPTWSTVHSGGTHKTVNTHAGHAQHQQDGWAGPNHSSHEEQQSQKQDASCRNSSWPRGQQRHEGHYWPEKQHCNDSASCWQFGSKHAHWCSRTTRQPPDCTEAYSIGGHAAEVLHVGIVNPSSGGAASHNHAHFQVLLSHRPLSFATTVLLACALCIHSILEGIALGAQQSMQATRDIMLAIAAHKGLAAYALGASIVESKASAGKFWTVVLMFALATPVGIGVGFAFSNIGKGQVSAAMSALASGTFLYVALNEVIPKELEHPDGHRLLKVGALLLGFGLMSLLAVWA